MNILLLNGGKYATETYEKQLAAWGHTLMSVPVFPENIEWDGKKISGAWLDELGRQLFGEYQFAVEAVQILIPSDYWKASTLGTHYGTPRNGYELAAIKHRKGWEDTGRHEFMHTLDDFVWTYLGKNLAPLAGVKDWDEDVVHGRDPRFKEYEYDKPYALVRSTVEAAQAQRDKLARQAATLSERVGIKTRLAVRRVTGKTQP